MTPFVPLSYDLELPHLRAAATNASALYQSAATEQLSSERCEHLSQMTEMPNDGRAVRPAMSRIQSIARPNFAGRHSMPSVTLSRILLLIKCARERVASFLLEMAERASGNIIELPMSRQDIADYLGLSLETVSRTLTSLETAAAIEVSTSRRIVLRNCAALRAC
jgi:CRP-like cAMP-binding protein